MIARRQLLKERRLQVPPRPTPWRRPSKDADIVYPEDLGAVRRDGGAHEARTPRATRTASTSWKSELLAQNAEHKDWTCSEEMMKLTKDGKALYLHCLPADISGLSCPEGEVDNSVFDRYLRAAVQAGLLQAVHHRRDDLPCRRSRILSTR